MITVKLVYNDPPRDQHTVRIYRWSLYAGSIKWKLYQWAPALECGLYKQMVLIYR